MKLGNMANMAKQAQKMQAQMMQIQEQLGEERVEGFAGGGMAKAVFTGHGELVELKIEPEIVNKDDVEMLEDIVLAAVNDGIQKSRELANSRMSVFSNVLGSLGLGG